MLQTFGLFMALWMCSLMASFNVWRNASVEEMMKVILATQIAYIIYSIITEEDRKP